MSYPVIIFDGPDGVGKTTQALLLGMYLTRGWGTRVSYFSFPVYESRIGRTIGRCLNRWGEQQSLPLLSPEDMAVLFALNRLEALPYLKPSIILGDFCILNRGPYSNLFNVARRALQDRVEWNALSSEEKGRRVNAVLDLDKEFIDSIRDKTEATNLFLLLNPEESMVLARQRALSTLGGDPDEYEKSYELQKLVGRIYQEIGEGKISGHQALLVEATMGSARRAWEGDLTLDGVRNEVFGIMATGRGVFREVFSRLNWGDWESHSRNFAERAIELSSGLHQVSKGEGSVDFEFRRRWNLPKGDLPDILDRRPELATEIQRGRPGVWEAIEASRKLDVELSGRGPERR